jgi:DNA-directed RNA polymerase subunit H (RpoH/RPB5)
MSISVEYNNRENNQIIIENILKMLKFRGTINSWENELKKFSSDDFQNKLNFKLDEHKIEIYLVNAKLTTIAQGHPLDVYLSNNLDIHKIIIATEVTKKVVKQIANDYKNAEFFFHYEMLEDITSNILVPKHEIITGDERKEVSDKFSDHELPRINLTDRMSRQCGAKIGDIIKVTEPTTTSGENTSFPKVVNSSWDILFP